MIRLLWSFLFCCLFASCNLFNPEEQKPAYIHIDSYDVQTFAGQGTDSDAISEMWVYSNSDILGVVDLPAEIPVLGEGLQRISVFAGIKNNGIGTSRIRYPFYSVYDTILDLSALEDFEVNPRFSCEPTAVIDDSRNFETGNYFAEGPNNQGQIELINDNEVAIDGSKCIKASLMANESYMHFIDDSSLEMESGNTVFLEMNYSCNNTFVIGVYAVANGTSYKSPILYITPTNDGDGSSPVWNKIYIDLGMAALENIGSNYYRIYFESASSESTIPTVYLDNLKVVNW